ncbi:MAG: Gx transporter family protein [Clostridium baratii]|uniref:Heptaprenyl diphosphate synthase component I family protein n=2 Tax=Clostridium baratii TaxID=1561 RepID=A0A0A7FTT7_9CLOT|nr:Gx transporter family protein [Clostridium baratii]AIY82305.1 heptaprenyl diphosphate synthase component I family protein [Clostridium baratii str. Sullivan]MBS6007555.1 Gx transporter family protein [Clostridium baratii]MDU1054331.1 Gx transporter family protein [Clostridium baratii]CUP62787.1 heptaprenyl diphosphate synthase component I [Clostridium baratii]
MKPNKINKMIYMSLLVGMALILFIIEGMIPVPFITPGAKLGLANLVIMIAVYTLGSYKEAFTVLFLRLLLSTMLGGSISTLMYSAAGGILSFIIIIIVKELGGKYVSIIGVSAAAAVFHNIGQLIVASLILKNIGVFLYLPILSIAGIGTGIFVGISANYLLSHLNKISYLKFD